MSSVYSDESERSTQRARSKGAEAAGAAQDAARDTMTKYADAARQTADDVAERAGQAGREMSGAVQEVAGNFKDAIERSVERQPVTTVLLAMAAGVLLGGLMRR